MNYIILNIQSNISSSYSFLSITSENVYLNLLIYYSESKKSFLLKSIYKCFKLFGKKFILYPKFSIDSSKYPISLLLKSKLKYCKLIGKFLIQSPI